jgi:hypothetical protein
MPPKTGTWLIYVNVGEENVYAEVVNSRTSAHRKYVRNYADFDDGPRWGAHDEAMAELINEVRDTFDEV